MSSQKEYVSKIPHLMDEWNWEKNVDFDPNQLLLGSHAKPWWKCSKGHEWQATIPNRLKGSGCPYCSGRYAIIGKTDLQTVNSILSKEWNHEKNGKLKPEHVTASSNKKVWWRCSKGHEWQASIGNRNQGRGCPYCSGKQVLKGYNDLQTVNPNLFKEWNDEKNGDIKPEYVTIGSNKKVWWKCSKGHEWQASIHGRNRGSGCPYCSGRYVIKNKTDLQTINPTLVKEWNYEKNIGLSPDHFTASTHTKVWWKCSEGHEWQAAISNRNKERGCPYCAGRQVLKGYNDLQTINPLLANEWNYVKNGNLKPEHFTANSNKKVWWKCGNGHEWQAQIASRNKGIGCAYCSGRKVLKGYNDLKTVNPTLANEWNYEKNNGLTPLDLTPGSERKVWWRCSKGHEWQAMVYQRNNGHGCPVCNSERKTSFPEYKTSFPEYALFFYLRKYGMDAIHSYNENGYELDVYIPSKYIAIEYDGNYWHKNQAKRDLSKNLKCKKDGIQLYRIREGLPPLNDSSLDYIVQNVQRDLPVTLEKVLSKIIGMGIDVDLERDAIAIENLREHTEKENSLLISSPEIAYEWNYEKNGNLKPEHFTANSNKKVWWKCIKGHEWQATINNRNHGGCGCPYCASIKILKGYNDLQTVNPTLAKEWNYEKNNGLTPEDIMPNSNKKAWWKCNKGHEWQASIGSRNSGCGCPYCSGRRAIEGETDLQTINPTLAKEWNYEKNGVLTPAEVKPNSNKKAWWKCCKGHEWQATINSRNQGSGCPQCAKEKHNPHI